MKRLSLFVLLLVVLSLSYLPTSYAGGDNPPDVEIKTTRDLKQFMYKFGSLVAGMEILRVKEKTPDWDAIDLTLKEMNENLQAMQKADKTNAYKTYTDQLSVQLIQVKKMSEKKSPQIYDAFDKLTNTCFQCHAAHRPADFLQPKTNRQMSQEQK